MTSPIFYWWAFVPGLTIIITIIYARRKLNGILPVAFVISFPNIALEVAYSVFNSSTTRSGGWSCSVFSLSHAMYGVTVGGGRVDPFHQFEYEKQIRKTMQTIEDTPPQRGGLAIIGNFPRVYSLIKWDTHPDQRGRKRLSFIRICKNLDPGAILSFFVILFIIISTAIPALSVSPIHLCDSTTVTWWFRSIEID